jgi:catechol 2,3-dioxygenase-like lactoylglutathione lyase family enzyme
MLRTQGIAHFSLAVSDMKRSVAFYSDIVGLELLLQTPELSFFRSGKDHVVLSAMESAPAAPAPQHLHHAFIVESRDFEPSLEFLASKGVDVVYEDERPEGSVFAGRSAYFHDPDGNMLEIIDLAATAFRPKGARRPNPQPAPA